ncbi:MULTISPECIES: SIR2 family protein [Aeromonas]|uniref:SIR2 family protein n=1 Tax=Aeromonas TaxID=642 RepID=UPI001BD3EFFE|nr:SIR2 family protein [Aeromonas caviae]MBS4709224.1 SIR2 family protein [Aeromonas caviae]MEE1910574.1 SIR2 family protein [Aeromonas caviae]
MIRWPKDVVSDISRRRCVIFLGSGISINSANADGRRPKTWLNFLESTLENIKPKSHIRKLLKESDYLTACEVIKRELGREEFTRVVRDEFLTPGYRPAEIHKKIFLLDSRIVATPNFDKIYETYANGEANGSIVVKQHYDTDVISTIRGSGRLILKVHGTIDSPDNLIFTRAEYAQARTKYSAFYDVLEALALTHTFVFLGCGVNDPDIKLLLEDTLFKHNSSRSHIMLLPNSALHTSVISVIQDTMNLKIIQYSPKDNHKELLDSITDLVQQVETEREQLKLDMNW